MMTSEKHDKSNKTNSLMQEQQPIRDGKNTKANIFIIETNCQWVVRFYVGIQRVK